MAIASWHPDLPDGPLIEGFETGAPNNQVRSTTDRGIDRVHRDGTGKPWRFSCPFRMSGAQLDIFKVFTGETLKQGTLRFSWIRPRTKEAVEMRFVPVSAERLYTEKPVGGGMYWDVSTILEVLP